MQRKPDRDVQETNGSGIHGTGGDHATAQHVGQLGAIAKLFHWLIAVFVLANLGLGSWADGLPSSPGTAEAVYWHKAIGLTVPWLAVLRLLWRFTNPAPRCPRAWPAGSACWRRPATSCSTS